MDPVVGGVFAFVYLGMILGELPGLKLDRTGIALLGAIALVASGRMTIDSAWNAVDVRTVALLLGLMVVSAQFRLGGFYTMVTRRLGAGDHTPVRLLALVILTAGLLSAVLANDIVCLAMAPVLIEVCTHRRLNRCRTCWHSHVPRTWVQRPL
jgi:Na+/H+ antiporter NhaD/arsenite permease-like protein